MAMGRRAREQQAALWIPAAEVAAGPSHPFYQRLNEILAKYGFDEWVESQCRRFYAERMGRPSLPPGIYFRILLIGYFEGIDSERGIAWRIADSLALRSFLGVRGDRGASGSFDDLSYPSVDRRRDAPSRV